MKIMAEPITETDKEILKELMEEYSDDPAILKIIKAEMADKSSNTNGESFAELIRAFS